MHPILAHRVRLLVYALAWIPVGGLLAALLVVAEPRPWGDALAFAVPLALVFGFLSLSAWFVCRATPLGRANPGRLLATHGFAAAATALAWIAVGAVVARLVGGAERYARDAPLLFVCGVVLFLLSSIVHYLFAVLEAAREAERRALELQVLAREAELRALRAQIHPHFLFNSLNTIAALTGTDPAGARRAAVQLGEFLRRTLRLGARETIPLAEEVELAAAYLAVEHARLGDRLVIDVHVEPEASACLVPPLLLQPLVENAVSHGIAPLAEGGVIRVVARRESGALRIEVENPHDASRPPRRGEGLGLANVRARLAALDRDVARLDVRETGERFSVTVTLPAVERAVA